VADLVILASLQLAAGFFFELFFVPEDGDSTLLRNLGKFLSENTAS
jgi:hypothetical protein